jgi:hypothetical protein
MSLTARNKKKYSVPEIVSLFCKAYKGEALTAKTISRTKMGTHYIAIKQIRLHTISPNLLLF